MFHGSMQFDLGEDINALRDMVHAWAQERVKPLAQKTDQENAITSLREAIIELGYMSGEDFDTLVDPNKMIKPSEK